MIQGETPSGLASSGSLLLFLEGSDPLQRAPVHHVGHRPERPRLRIVAGHLRPALRTDAELLAEKRDEDLRLLLPEARQRLEALEKILATLRLLPEPLGAAVVLGDD